MDNRQGQNSTDAFPEKAVIIDLREKDDYEAGHIPGAQMISAGSLREEIRRIARFNTPILLYCYTGKKSAQAAELLQSRGYENARSIGGTEAYTGKLEPEVTIRELRAKKSLSQAALARMIGVRQPTVAAYESGKAFPGPAICETIRRLLFATVSPRDKTAAGIAGMRKSLDAARGEQRSRAKKCMTIREIRKAHGLTQAKFAETIGVCNGSVVAYEAGRTRPGKKVVETIREIYGVDVSCPSPDHMKAAGRPAGSKHDQKA